MQMDWALSISLASLAISAASVAYAHSALRAAHNANRIGLHQTHRQIFDAMLDFRTLFVDMDLHPTPDEMDAFYRNAVGPAQLYLPSHLVEPMYSIYRRSRELYSQIDDGGSEAKWAATNELQRLGKEDLDALIKKVAHHVSIDAV